MVQVIFSRRHHPGSVLLRTFMWSPWSHCGIVTTNDTVIQATTAGVVETPLQQFKDHSSKWAIVEYDADYAAVMIAAQEQLGKKYDWAGCAGIALHRDWTDDDAWFCSELVAYTLAQGGAELFRLEAKRITPQHLWMLNRPVLLMAA